MKVDETRTQAKPLADQEFQTSVDHVLKNQILNERYMIFDQVGSGAYGSIYQCGDLKKPKHHLVTKISDDVEHLGNEIEALTLLRAHYKKNEKEYPYEYFPRCTSKGLFLYNTCDPNQNIVGIKTDE